MASLPTPVPPLPARHVDREERAALDDLDDQESLAKTVERKSVRITTARFASLAPCAMDVLPASASASSRASASPPAASASMAAAFAAWSSMASTLRLHPRAAIGAAVWVACVIAGISGVLLGHSASHAHASSAVADQSARAPHAAVVVEAREEVTEMPILAPGKVSESPVAEAAPAAARPLRRTGFGHLGADRVASGAGGRRAAPHRR